jgi:hypothetical protein
MTMCSKCKLREALPDRSRCEKCRAWMHARYAARKAAGVCPQEGCGAASEPGHSYCPEHGRLKRDALREFRARRRVAPAPRPV